jgi:soluble lytic murein transglycosylase-like protein
VPAVAAAQSIPSQPNLKAIFAVVGRTHNIDPELLEAMAEVESGGDPLSVSPKGALGLMQLMPTTANAFSVLDPFNPVANVRGAADFLDYLRNRFAIIPTCKGCPLYLPRITRDQAQWKSMAAYHHTRKRTGMCGG